MQQNNETTWISTFLAGLSAWFSLAKEPYELLSPPDYHLATSMSQSTPHALSMMPFDQFVRLAQAFGCPVADLFSPSPVYCSEARHYAPRPVSSFKTCLLRDIIDYYADRCRLSVRDISAVVRIPQARFYERVDSGLTMGQVAVIASRLSLSLHDFLLPFDPTAQPYRRGFCGNVSPVVADGWIRDDAPLSQLQQVADALHCEVWELFVSRSFVEAERARRRAAWQPPHLVRYCPKCMAPLDLKFIKTHPGLDNQ